MTRLRARWWMAAFTLALAAACAGSGTGSPDRIAELEGRVARLERLFAPEAGPSDAAPVVVVYDASAPYVEPPDAHPTPAVLLTECLARAEATCAMAVTESKKQRERGRHDGGFGWTPVQSADASAEGRACLTRERESCDRDPQFGTRPVAVDAWLDAQLTPDRIDRAFSEKVRQRIDEIDGHAGTTQVECIREFCRMKDLRDAGQSYAVEAVHYADSQFFKESESRLGRQFGYMYVTRNGYRFPE